MSDRTPFCGRQVQRKFTPIAETLRTAGFDPEDETSLARWNENRSRALAEREAARTGKKEEQTTNVVFA